MVQKESYTNVVSTVCSVYISGDEKAVWNGEKKFFAIPLKDISKQYPFFKNYESRTRCTIILFSFHLQPSLYMPDKIVI